MTPIGNERVDLLARLGSGVRPEGPARAVEASSGPTAFASLLNKAKAGEVSSGLALRGGEEHGLTGEEMERLGRAADAAEAAGALRLLALIGGKAVTIDIATRTVVSAVDAQQAGMVTGVDAVVTLGETSAAPVLPPGRAVLHPGLMRTLGAAG